MRLAVLLLLAVRLAAQGVEARTPHFRVTAVGPPETATLAASSLERSYQYLVAAGFTAPASPPTEVVLFPDRASMEPYAPRRSIGFFQAGSDASFIAVAWQDSGDPIQALAHELAHRVLFAGNGSQPLWLREGAADLLSNLRPAPEGLKLGLPIPAHLGALRRAPWLDWQQVLDATHKSPITQDPAAAALFYAQSWLLVHRLAVGRPRTGSLAAQLHSLSVPAGLPDRFPEALPAEILPVSIPADSERHPTARPLDPWECEHRLAELLRALNRDAQAREALLSLRSRFPARPEPVESLGALEMDAIHYDRAQEWLAEAVRLGSSNPATHYRYSLLLMRPGQSAENAARHARRAADLEPSLPLHWLALAHAEMQLRQWEPARASLGESRKHSSDPLLLEQVRIELEEIERRTQEQLHPPRGPQPPVPVITAVAPEAPAAPSVSRPSAPAKRPTNPHPGTLTFWGWIRKVECTDQGKILTVTNPRLVVRVRERPGHPARLHSPPRNLRAIPCSLKDLEVNVVYRPSAQFGPINGDLVAVLF